MNREALLAATAVGLLAVVAIAALAGPGVLADPDPEEPVRPGHVGIAEVAVSPAEVTGETVQLQLTTALAHRGNAADNVTVRHRAYDADSGLLTAEETVDVGEVDVDGEQSVEASLTVPRDGGYRLETTVFRGSERLDTTSTTVRGVEALEPPYERTTVSFADRPVLPSLSVGVEDASDGTATLRISALVANGGDDPVNDVELRIVLRQADSNVVADEGVEPVGELRPGRTHSVDATVEVPDGYNYYVDAALVRNDVILDETREAANLNPQETLDVNETREEIAFEIEEFTEETAEPRPEATPAPEELEEETPGFGPLVGGVAVIALALLLARSRRTPGN
ncbi:Uncharacterized protein AArcCO_2017 [Halalkaliarchaeum sp. AArc-CO]|uniref:DUF7490 domain-containing protein n=1 Tax=unclassified Halalkaliarchaeum TaxID=2678344 RepID=UPI00217E4F1B|nr:MULTISPECIES: FxLYD domain-containing protein [unclassified Halalkaliarchaeum]MDR5671812.1 FxLYD domain-containing protein [Halalkaliarchaeum sp. AArc-GB]UWG51314.1 Uncharacterized protein AArcCO_2017 [Halalkaliarchaeum sp. AArc-CO]